MTEKQIKILVYRVGQLEPELRTISDTLEEMRAIVLGNIEGWMIAPRLMLICNGEGRETLPENRKVNRLGMVHGDFFISRHDSEGDSESITDRDIELAKEAVHPCLI